MSGYLEGEIRAGRADERLGHVAHLSVWSIVPKLAFGAALLAGAVAAFALWPTGTPTGVGPSAAATCLALLASVPIGSALATFYATEIGVTNRRVLYKRGLYRRRTFEMVLEKVESLSIDQSVLGRLLDFGSIRVAAASDDNIVIASVAAPFVLKREIDEAKGMRLDRQVRSGVAAPTNAEAEPIGA